MGSGYGDILHQQIAEATGMGEHWKELVDDLNARYGYSDRERQQLLDDIWANSNELTKMLGYQGFMYLLDWAKARY